MSSKNVMSNDHMFVEIKKPISQSDTTNFQFLISHEPFR